MASAGKVRRWAAKKGAETPAAGVSTPLTEEQKEEKQQQQKQQGGALEQQVVAPPKLSAGQVVLARSGVKSLASTAFASGVRLAYTQRYAEEIARVQQLLPPGSRWVDSHCHFESILGRTWRGGGKPQVMEGEEILDLEGLVRSWPEGLDGCISNFVFKRLSKPGARLSEWGWIEEHLPQFSASGPVGSKIWFTIGLHPHDAGNWDAAAEQKVRKLAQHPKCVGIGECGFDFFKHSEEEAEKQEQAFRAQAQLAVELGKALVIHARQAESLCLKVLSDLVPESHPIHLHCFSDSLSHALLMCQRWPNLRIGFTGSVTFTPKLAKGKGKGKGKGGSQDSEPVVDRIEELLLGVPLERLLLETDGPYMAPEPFRGQTAHPGLVHRVAEKIAQVKGVPLAQVMEATRMSTRVVYGI
ncbi:unnamed protein product [Polarella glacialis]|uniref:Uncharacterized protein n=1 Tax=Polarella glacialis TaxID=89957 RepID=A0A813DGE1_POLGL|nr:unnamed protein product [Polarella glacialis]